MLLHRLQLLDQMPAALLLLLLLAAPAAAAAAASLHLLVLLLLLLLLLAADPLMSKSHGFLALLAACIQAAVPLALGQQLAQEAKHEQQRGPCYFPVLAAV
jgi:uncharacterized membrane protein